PAKIAGPAIDMKLIEVPEIQFQAISRKQGVGGPEARSPSPMPLSEKDKDELARLSFITSEFRGGRLHPDVLASAAKALSDMRQTAHMIAKINHLSRAKTDGFMEALIRERSDLAGLPYTMGEACRLRADRSAQLAAAVALVRSA